MIRTVLGYIATTTLGRTDCHEHLFQVSPLLPRRRARRRSRVGADLLHTILVENPRRLPARITTPIS
jgi:predicted metal-dependent phosphotriesterase family hydrolase